MDRKLFTVCLLAATLLAFPLMGDAATITGPIKVDVSSSLGNGSLEVSVDNGAWDGDVYSWSLGDDVEIRDDTSGALLATLLADTTITAVADPVLQLSFNAQAGAATTSITVFTPELSFPAISNPPARASAGIVVVDANGNGASMTGGFNGNTRAYEAAYNGSVQTTGTTFATLVGNASVGTAFGAVSMQDESPAPGMFTTIPASVSSMDAEFRLTLSAGDRVVGNSVFVVVPEPSTLALVALCGLALVSFRRKLT